MLTFNITCDILPLMRIYISHGCEARITPENSPSLVQYLIMDIEILAAAFFGDITVCKLKEKCLT